MPEKIDEQFIVKTTREPIKISNLTLSELLHQKITSQDPNRIAIVSEFFFSVFFRFKINNIHFRLIHKMVQN